MFARLTDSPLGITPAAAQVPVQAVTEPPPEHHADPSLTTYVFRVGPFSIGGYQTFRRTDVVTPPPVAGSIVGMDVRIVDTDGAEIPQSQLMLHHNVFTNGGADNTRKDGACPHRAVKERFYGTSEELRPLTLPRGYGYRTTPAGNWKMIWMAMNHRHQRREAYVEYRVTVDACRIRSTRCPAANARAACTGGRKRSTGRPACSPVARATRASWSTTSRSTPHSSRSPAARPAPPLHGGPIDG